MLGGDELIYRISVWLLPALLAITLHEAAHGYAALRFGDDTALRAGRLSLNPLRHIDPVGTVLLPGLLLLTGSPFLFGYAKPVPVNFWRLRNPKRDMIWVAAAGPLTNLVMATAAAFLVHGVPLLPQALGDWVFLNLRNAVALNIVLAVFNMIPLPPLDGGRVAVGLLPQPLSMALARLEPYGMLILIFFLLVLPSFPGLGINPLGDIIGPPSRFLYELILRVTGH
ncbi:MAG TPA: site-2 protease family protein [Stellaceae bacterium]|nr:site-2 protease family protein [Stellaceae bacterium]